MFRNPALPILLAIVVLITACSAAQPQQVAPVSNQERPGTTQNNAPAQLNSKCALWPLNELKQGLPPGPIRSLGLGASCRLFAGGALTRAQNADGTSSDGDSFVGLYIFEGEAWNLFQPSLLWGQVNDVSEPIPGHVYVGVDALNKTYTDSDNREQPYLGGLWHIRPEGDPVRELNHTVFSFGYRTFNGQQQLVASTWEGVWTKPVEDLDTNGQWTKLYGEGAINLGPQHIHNFAQLGDYDCLGSTDQGITCVNQLNPDKRFTLHKGGAEIEHLPGSKIRAFHQIEQDTWLVATEDGGTAELGLTVWPGTDTLRPGISEARVAVTDTNQHLPAVSDVLVDSSGNQWIAAYAQGVYHQNDGGSWIQVSPYWGNDLLLYQDSDGKDFVLAGTALGIEIFALDS